MFALIRTSSKPNISNDFQRRADPDFCYAYSRLILYNAFQPEIGGVDESSAV